MDGCYRRDPVFFTVCHSRSSCGVFWSAAVPGTSAFLSSLGGGDVFNSGSLSALLGYLRNPALSDAATLAIRREHVDHDPPGGGALFAGIAIFIAASRSSGNKNVSFNWPWGFVCHGLDGMAITFVSDAPASCGRQWRAGWKHVDPVRASWTDRDRLRSIPPRGLTAARSGSRPICPQAEMDDGHGKQPGGRSNNRRAWLEIWPSVTRLPAGRGRACRRNRSGSVTAGTGI